MAQVSKTERILNLTSFLLKSHTPLPWAEIRESVIGYDDPADPATLERRFERDKEFLRAVGVPITYVSQDEFGRSGYAIEKDSYFLPHIEVTAQEAALLGALRHLFPVGLSALEGPLESALRKVCFDAPSPPDFGATVEEARLISRSGVEPKRSRYSVEGENLGMLVQAISLNKRVRFSYYSIARDATDTREVDPYGLGFTGGAWYLVGFSHERGDIRIFRVSRIKARVRFCTPASQGGEFSLPRGFKLSDHLGLPPWELKKAKRIRVKVRLDTVAGWMAAAESFGQSDFAAASNGSGVITLWITDEDALVRWLLRFTTHAVVVSPVRIHKRVVEEIKAVKRLYTGSAGSSVSRRARGRKTHAKRKTSD